MKRHLSAILVGDIVGYSRLMEADEAGMIARQKSHLDDTVKPAIERLDGRIVKLMGDGILIEFPSVVSAVACAVSIQQSMQKREGPIPEDQRIAYRIGINLGDVFYEEGDVFGDGVNIAARLEALADPGGICISGTAFDHLKSNIPVTYQPLGNISVKNISQPVRAYRVLMPGQAKAPPLRQNRSRVLAFLLGVALIAGGAVWWGLAIGRQSDGTRGAAPAPVDQTLSVARRTDRPSIAVLPFDNLSNDPEQDYFSDGMTEDLITDLSQVSGLFVLARNTVFTYKNKAVNVTQVGQELGVAFVLEGSVRRTGDRVRINAQLIDTKTGGHVWAERYDRDMIDVFALQDDVVQRIVTALKVTLKTGEKARLSQSGKIDPGAYDAQLRGLEKLRRFSRETNLEARALFEKAIALQPDFARAHADLALTYTLAAEQQWAQDRDEAAKRGIEIGLKAQELDPDLAQLYFVQSVAYRNIGRMEDSLAASRNAIKLDPNYADGYASLAISLNYAGLPQEALATLHTATRLNPLKPFFYVWIEGQSHYLLGEYDVAARRFEDVVESNPHFPGGQKMLAASYAALGQTEDAEWAAAELLSLSPGFTIADELLATGYLDKAVREMYIGHLRQAGLK